MKLSKITTEYSNRSYSELNCVSLVRSIAIDLGFKFPDSYNQYSIDNFQDAYNKDPLKMQAFLIKALLSFSSKVKKLSVGNIILVKRFDEEENRNYIWPAIYVGKGMAMTSFVDHGSFIFKYDIFGKPFLFLQLEKK